MERGTARTRRTSGSVRAVERSLAILGTFTLDHSERGLDEISDLIHLPKSTTHRLLQTLVGTGFVDLGRRHGAYRLGLQAATVGRIAALDRRPEEGVFEAMRALRDETDEAVGLSVLRNDTIVIVAKEMSRHPLSYNLGVGATLPAYCTASGKVLLADLSDSGIDRLYPDGRLMAHTSRTVSAVSKLKVHLKQIRDRGYAIDNEELAEGLRCIAVPIRDPIGRATHALAVSAPSARLTMERLRDLIEPLTSAASQISLHMSLAA